MKKKSMSLEEQVDDELEEEDEEEAREESESEEDEDVDLFLMTTFLLILSLNKFLFVWTSRNPHLGQIDFSSGRLDRKEIHFQ